MWRIAAPMILSNISIPLVGITDTVITGHLENPEYLASIAVATTIIGFFVASMNFLRMGTTGLVSQSLGKGDYREIVLTAFRNLTFAVFAGIIILLSKYPILNLIKYYFKTSEQTYFLISEYISVRLFSAPAELSIYVIVGLFIGLQKTKILRIN